MTHYYDSSIVRKTKGKRNNFLFYFSKTSQLKQNNKQNTMNPSNPREELSVAVALTALGNQSASNSKQTSPAQSPVNLPVTSRNASPVQTKPSSTSSHPFKGAKMNFAQKLFEILEDPGNTDIIKWLPGGKGWIMMDKKRFAAEVLPVYFKQTQFTSFTRKLSRWKFIRVPKGPYMGAYYHKFFRRDRKYLCILMSCNNETPSLVDVAKVRQQAISAGDFGAASAVADDLPDLQKTALKNLEEMNKVMIKEQLLNLRMRKAQLFEENKMILANAEARITDNIMRIREERQAKLDFKRKMAQIASIAILQRSQRSFPLSYNVNASAMSSLPKRSTRPVGILRNPIPQQNRRMLAYTNNDFRPSVDLPSLQQFHALAQVNDNGYGIFRASAA